MKRLGQYLCAVHLQLEHGTEQDFEPKLVQHGQPQHDLLVPVAPISNSALPENLRNLMRLMMTSHVYMFWCLNYDIHPLSWSIAARGFLEWGSRWPNDFWNLVDPVKCLLIQQLLSFSQHLPLHFFCLFHNPEPLTLPLIHLCSGCDTIDGHKEEHYNITTTCPLEIWIEGKN